MRNVTDFYKCFKENRKVGTISKISLQGVNRKVLGFRYRELDENSQLVKWLWSILESFTDNERVLFMRFVSGRSRLPANLADLSQRFQVRLFRIR